MCSLVCVQVKSTWKNQYEHHSRLWFCPSFFYAVCFQTRLVTVLLGPRGRIWPSKKHTYNSFDMNKFFHLIYPICSVSLASSDPTICQCLQRIRGKRVLTSRTVGSWGLTLFSWAGSSCWFFAALHSSHHPGVNVVWVTFRRNKFSPQIWHSNHRDDINCEKKHHVTIFFLTFIISNCFFFFC